MSPGSDRVDSAFEAEAIDGNVVREGSFQEKRTDKIIDDRVHPEFTLDEGGRETAQNVQGEVGFDLPEVEFDLPALVVECGDG